MTAVPTPDTRHRLTLADRARLWLLKSRLDWHLEGRVPRRRRKEIVREIRANVVAAAGDHGVAGAIARLGDVRIVAREYVDVEDSRLRVRVGFIAALAVWMTLHYLALLIALAFDEGARSVGGEEASWSYAWEIAEGFGPFAASYDAPQGLYTVSILTPVHVIVPLLAFALGARLWRWRPRKGSTGW